MFYLEFSFNHIYLFVSYRMHLAQIRHNILINPLVLAVFRLSLIPNKIEKRKLNIKVLVFRRNFPDNILEYYVRNKRSRQISVTCTDNIQIDSS